MLRMSLIYNNNPVNDKRSVLRPFFDCLLSLTRIIISSSYTRGYISRQLGLKYLSFLTLPHCNVVVVTD